MTWLEGFLLAVAAGSALSIVLHTLLTGISPMPTLPGERQALLDLIPRDVRGGVFELGAGWGSLALPLAARFPELSVLAFERSPVPWGVCRLRALLRGRTRLRVLREDFFKADLSQAGLVVCYLSAPLMMRLSEKLRAELPDGACVLSNTFALPGWAPETVRQTGGWFGGPVYRYVKRGND